MSEKSFAVASVSVAIIWGTFFYPPTPHMAKSADSAAAVVQAQPASGLRADVLTGHSAKVSSMARPAAAMHSMTSHNDCALSATHGGPDCTPLPKLASD